VSALVLECRNIHKQYGGIAALDGVSARFEPGNIVAIIGPNGAGKTTLLNVISGFEHCDSGEVTYGERNIAAMRPESIARLGIARTFQRSRVITELTVMENLLLAASSDQDESVIAAILGGSFRSRAGTLRERTVSAMELTGLGGYDDRLAGELSYGEQKLLAIAACISGGARTILLDEPLGGVAPHLIDQILRILHDLAGSGSAVVFIEHDLMSVKVVATQIMAMHHGRIITTGTPNEVLGNRALVEAFLE